MRLRALTALSFAIAASACARASATADDEGIVPQRGEVTVTGRVVNSDGSPVSEARVYIPGAGAVTRTDANGYYNLTGVPDGPQEVVVRSRGYAPTRVDAKFSTKASDRDRNRINVTLLTEPEAATLASQQARDSAALARVGFVQREDRIRGAYFLTPADVASIRANRVSDLFRQVPVLIQTTGPTGTVLRGAQGCLATYVDGIRWRSMFPGDLDTYVPVNDVVAAEVYPPGQLPPPPFNQLANRVNCTTLAIWTRSAVG